VSNYDSYPSIPLICQVNEEGGFSIPIGSSNKSRLTKWVPSTDTVSPEFFRTLTFSQTTFQEERERGGGLKSRHSDEYRSLW
jgi:hypothetical protein